MRIYVASSWRNQKITVIVEGLRALGHEVYDFREDDEQGAAFNWHDIDPKWKEWTPEQFRENLQNPIADRGFKRDMDALLACEGLLLVMPCGRSAHLELGVAIGMQKPTAILLSDGEPELMYRAAGAICSKVGDAIDFFDRHEASRRGAFTRKGRPITKSVPAK